VSRDIHLILKQYWGYSSFRPLQQDIINAVLDNNDVLALLPTGGGKSICFQVPAMATEGICLVISPLIALIKDQVEALNEKGIPALSLHAGMSYIEVKQTLQNAAFGNYKFLYVSPERLQSSLFLEFLPAMKLSLLAIDEAHCISQWGYDFRPSYLQISALRELIPATPCIALTASATPIVQEDICAQLNYKKHKIFRQSFARPELSYSVFDPPARQAKLFEILKNVPGSSIVYCKSRKQTEVIAAELRQQGFEAEHYHAGLSAEQRAIRQDSWIENRLRIIVCTNAFGMGIDKPDVRTVIHYDVPECIENYYQEAGRAGRDGKRAYAILFTATNISETLIRKVDIRYPSSDEIKKVYVSLMNYLQVAAGTGEGLSFDFDQETFCRNFSLDMYSSTFALEILAKLDIISLGDFNKKRSKLVFSCTRNDLNEYQQANPGSEELIKGLLRSYEGIFDYPSYISEKSLARFTGLEQFIIESELKKLQSYGLVKYEPASNKPQVLLLKNRMYLDDYLIREKDLRAQHKIALDRAKAMVEYLTNLSCRNVFISRYFGDDSAGKCGICDNCINERDQKLSVDAFVLLKDQLISLLREKPLTPIQVIENLQHIPEKKIWETITILQQEELLFANRFGEMELKSQKRTS